MDTDCISRGEGLGSEGASDEEAAAVQSTLVCRVCKSEFMSETDVYKLVTCLHVFCRPCLGAAVAESLVALKPLQDLEAEDAVAGLVPCPVDGCPDCLRREDLRFVVGANIVGFLDDWLTSALVQKVLRPVLRRCPNCEEAPQLLLPHQLGSLPKKEIRKAHRRHVLTLGSLSERLRFNYLSALKEALASAPAFFLCSSCFCLVCKDCGACLRKLLLTQASAAHLGAHQCNPSLKQCFEMAHSMMKLCAAYGLYIQGEGSTNNIRSSRIAKEVSKKEGSHRALFSVTISSDHGDLKLKSSWLQDVFGEQNDMKNSLKQNTDTISDDMEDGYDVDGEDLHAEDEKECPKTPAACKRSFKPSLTSVVDIQALEALQELKKMLEGMFKETEGMRYQLPPAIVALLCSHDLPCMLLKWLIKNLDSVMDVTARSSLYWELVAFMRLLSGCSELFPLLCSPQAKHDCWADKSRWETTGSVMAAFENLYKQAQFMLRSKQLLQFEQYSREEGEEEQQHPPLLDLALVSEIKAVYKLLRRKISSWEKKTSQNKWLADASGFFHDRIWERLTAPNVKYAEEMYDVIKSLCEGSSVASTEASSSEGSSINAQTEAYKKALRPLQFREGSILPNHYFRREVMQWSKGMQKKERARVIAEEIVQLNTALPLEWSSSIFVRIDEHRPDVLRALIIGPAGTPYQNGVFVFDMLLDEDYPQKPPKMRFLTTGGGNIRFNPNLYDNGLVCLSLLGTWKGPSWQPSESTILQVLVSIQGLVLVADPYYNEPGYHKPASGSDPLGERYMRLQRLHTLRYSMLPALLAPDPLFEDVILTHFTLKAVEIQEQCDAWIADAPADHLQKLIQASEDIKHELAKLLIA